MLKALTVSLCLAIPMTAFAQDAAPVQQPAPEAVVPPAADQPAQANLTPEAAVAPEQNGAVEGARHCGMYGKGCSGGRGGKAKFIVGGVIGTVLTATAVGLAVGFATRNQNPVVR